MTSVFQALEPEMYYHIYNHANGNENLFDCEDNYLYFLKRYVQYITPVADTFAYCLMPNHFHLALRIKSRSEIEGLDAFRVAAKEVGTCNCANDLLSQFVSQQFSNLFNAYSKAYNKQNNRHGGLFMPRFKRKRIDTESYFRELLHYIHFNPVHHGFVDDLRDWKFSSYSSFFSEKPTCLKRDEVIAWFDNKESFWCFHQKRIDAKMVLELE